MNIDSREHLRDVELRCTPEQIEAARALVRRMVPAPDQPEILDTLGLSERDVDEQ